jgi:hypothetical protein
MATGSWGPAIDDVEPVRTYVRIRGQFFHEKISSEVYLRLFRPVPDVTLRIAA